jgi:hypothetical protein
MSLKLIFKKLEKSQIIFTIRSNLRYNIKVKMDLSYTNIDLDVEILEYHSKTNKVFGIKKV